MKIKKYLVITLAIVAAAGIFAGCGSPDTSQKAAADSAKAPLRVATNATFVPFEFKSTEDADYKGFEIDMIRAVGKEMGREIQFQNIPFNGIIPVLQSGDIDVAASGMTITKERAAKVLFAAPFYESKLVILTKKNSPIQSVDDLQGYQIAVQMGTMASDYAQNKGLKTKQFDHNAEALMELRVGGSEAVITDKPVADYYASKEGQGEVKVIDIPDSTKQYLAFAVNKKDVQLQKDLNAAIEQLKKTGEFQKIYQKWFNTDGGILPKTAEETLK